MLKKTASLAQCLSHQQGVDEGLRANRAPRVPDDDDGADDSDNDATTRQPARQARDPEDEMSIGTDPVVANGSAVGATDIGEGANGTQQVLTVHGFHTGGLNVSCVLLQSSMTGLRADERSIRAGFGNYDGWRAQYKTIHYVTVKSYRPDGLDPTYRTVTICDITVEVNEMSRPILC